MWHTTRWFRLLFAASIALCSEDMIAPDIAARDLTPEKARAEYATARRRLDAEFAFVQGSAVIDVSYAKSEDDEPKPSAKKPSTRYTGYYSKGKKRIDRELVSGSSHGLITSYVSTGDTHYIVHKAPEANQYVLDYFGHEETKVATQQIVASWYFEAAYKSYLFDVNDFFDPNQFTITDVTPKMEGSRNPSATTNLKVHFIRTSVVPLKVDGKDPVIFITSGFVTLNPAHLWRLEAYSVQTNEGGTFAGETIYKELAGGLFHPSGVAIKLSKKGGSAYHDIRGERYEFVHPADDLFSPKHFGLDLMDAADTNAGFINYPIVFSVVGIICLLGAMWLRFKARIV